MAAIIVKFAIYVFDSADLVFNILQIAPALLRLVEYPFNTLVFKYIFSILEKGKKMLLTSPQSQLQKA